MESNDKAQHEELVKKYEPYLTRKKKGKGGIFTTVTRGTLLDVPVKGRKKRGKNYDFWYDVRTQVKTALVDLALFIETAGDEKVNEVLTAEALEPVVESLLGSPKLLKAEPNVTRAEIAKLFIHMGFQYLQRMQKGRAGELYNRAIEEAIRTCSYLVEVLRGYGKPGYVSPVERWEHPAS